LTLQCKNGGAELSNKGQHWKTPGLPIGGGVFFILLAIFVLLRPSAGKEANIGWAGLLGLPLWVLAAGLLIIGVVVLVLGIRQLILSRRG